MAEAEAVARALAEPVILSQVLQTRATHEASEAASTSPSRPLTRRFDGRTLRPTPGPRRRPRSRAPWPRATPLNCASASTGRASLLDGVGNVYQLAYLFAAAYGALCYGSDHDATDFVGHATQITRELDSPHLWMLLRGKFGLVALLTGDTDAAAEAFRDELALCRELVALSFASEGLYGLAAVAVVRNDVDRAARLAGAAAAHRYGYAEDAVDARLRAGSSSPPARAAGMTPGTPPSAKGPR